ncbi:MAG TPA: maleylpyruvate isomerase family mycothiol-dependent enzyme [Mycobacteriales bacterium]|nr:maleylpyruvate isomerase family mycothiol-dependent enzyme [Mycobacteriales bacterium]
MSSPGLQRYVDALEETWTGLADTVDGIADADWQASTGCPGWTVKDNVAHVASLEVLLAGRDEPEHTAPPAPHVRDGLGQMMENLVDRRRSWSNAEVLAELRSITAERLAYLRGLGDDADQEIRGMRGLTKASGALGLRVFDCLAHEQDVRRALGKPGNLDGVAAHVTATRISLGVPSILEAAGVADVRVIVRVGADALTTDVGTPTTTVTFPLEQLVTLFCGRSDGTRDGIVVDGDAAVGDAVVAALTALTP